MQTIKMYSTIFSINKYYHINQTVSKSKRLEKNNLLRHCSRCPFHFNAQQRSRDRFFSIQITSTKKRCRQHGANCCLGVRTLKAAFKFTPRESSKKLSVKCGMMSGKEETEDVIRLMRNSFQLSTVFQRFVFLEGGMAAFCALHRS
jgi:hypothetical protein